MTTAKTPKPLTPKQARFVALFLVSLNATEAYREAYQCSQRVADTAGPRLFGNVRVASAIADAQKRLSERTEITQDMVLQRLWAIATADAREISEYRHTCCRHCYGENSDYQLTEREIDRRLLDAQRNWELRKNKKATDVFDGPDTLGGSGWDPRKPPNEHCPECFGAGVRSEVFKDTASLSPSAVLLFAGVKRTKDGLEIKTHDQQVALVKAGEHLGMFKGGANVNVNVNLEDLNEAQLEHLAKGGSLDALPR